MSRAMPRSRLETSVVVVGLAALALLVWLSVVTWDHYQRERSAPEPTTSVRTEAGPTRATASVAATTVPRTVDAKLTLKATRGACWVEIRAGSASGRQLYAGILAASRSISVSGRRFWLSLGAASNVDARFGGQVVQGFPKGVATVTVDGAKVVS
jgi:hypothetical protein